MKPLNHVAVIWQRFLPYHIARLRNTAPKLQEQGIHFTGIEVAAQDSAYGFPINNSSYEFDHICCFPDGNYHLRKTKEIHRRVFNVLEELQPDVVFAPATPFPEGMAAYHYQMKHKKKAILMDDAWELTDQRGWLTKFIKSQIHKNIDGAFIPAPSHLNYFLSMGFPRERIVYGVDVVDNDYFSQQAKIVRSTPELFRQKLTLPLNYFLFVGRFLPRKGIETLIDAYKIYRDGASGKLWDLVLVGSGTHKTVIEHQAEGIAGIHFVGPQFGDDLCVCYALAKVLIVPSISDPWGLVINEGMASGLPIIASNGCGAANTLVNAEENGWVFDQGNKDTLARIMMSMNNLPLLQLNAMGQASLKLISRWKLNMFSEGVLSALAISERKNRNILSTWTAALWKGRVRPS